MILKITLLIVFFAVTVGVGIYCRKNSTDVNGFVLGGRSVGPWLTAFAFGTSYFSAVIFVGYAGQFGWNFGVASTWIGLGNAFIGSLMAWVILGRRTRLMTQKLDSRTMPDFFEHRYQSKGLKLFASLVFPKKGSPSIKMDGDPFPLFDFGKRRRYRPEIRRDTPAAAAQTSSGALASWLSSFFSSGATSFRNSSRHSARFSVTVSSP